jgi:hypothetical protein
MPVRGVLVDELQLIALRSDSNGVCGKSERLVKRRKGSGRKGRTKEEVALVPADGEGGRFVTCGRGERSERERE